MLIKKIYVASIVLVSFFSYADKPIKTSEMDNSIASSIVKNMMIQSENADIKSVAKSISDLKVEKLDEGINQHFTDKTIETLNLDKDKMKNDNIASNQLVMFVSSSIPMKTLRNYARDLAKVGGVMAMIGMVNGLEDYKEHMRFSMDVLKVNPNCKISTCETFSTEILVDPVLFQMYDIKAVPALIYQPDMKINSYCDDLTKAEKSKGIVYGDAYLGYLIKELMEETGDTQLENLINRLENR